MFILLRRKKLKAIIHSLQNKNDTFVATEFNKFIKKKMMMDKIILRVTETDTHVRVRIF